MQKIDYYYLRVEEQNLSLKNKIDLRKKRVQFYKDNNLVLLSHKEQRKQNKEFKKTIID